MEPNNDFNITDPLRSGKTCLDSSNPIKCHFLCYFPVPPPSPYIYSPSSLTPYLTYNYQIHPNYTAAAISYPPHMISAGYIKTPVHVHPPDRARHLTSMCSFVRSHGRWARILLSSPSCCNFCGASFRPFSHFRSPPTWRKSFTCRLTK